MGPVAAAGEGADLVAQFLQAGVAVPGAVQAVGGMAGEGQSSGVHIGQCHVQYPKQFPPEQFVGPRQSVSWDIVKFHAGGAWSNDLAMAVTGYLSKESSPLVGYPHSDNPNVPVNRFAVLSFGKSATSEDMSQGLLTANVEAWGGGDGVPEGSAEDPWVALHVSGRFDPFGTGDVEYGFKLLINTFGAIQLDAVTGKGDYHWYSDFTITNEGDHILVKI